MDAQTELKLELKTHAREAAWQWYEERCALTDVADERERWEGTTQRIIDSARMALMTFWDLFSDVAYADAFVAALMDYKTSDTHPQ